MRMLVVNSHFLSVSGPEQHAEESAVRVVLCRSAPAGEDHLEVPLRDPAEDQPVRAFVLPHIVFLFSFSSSLISS